MSTGIVETPENQQRKQDRSTIDEEQDRTRRHGGAQVRQSFKAPSLRLVAMEQRASQEFLAFMATAARLRRMSQGDGHPVMVLPPFGADDTYSAPLRWVLHGQGYSVHGWRQGTNRHRTAKIVEGLPRCAVRTAHAGAAKVSLIGHSDGGNWARELAREFPWAVRQVITLGSPFRLRPGDSTCADSLAERILGEQIPPPPAALIDEDDRPPIPVAVTAIYTRTDGVAAWEAGLESEGPRRENIEVVGSHCGLGYNVAAIIAIADRLAQPEECWQPFWPSPSLRHLFPKPVYWQTHRWSDPGVSALS